MVYRRKPRKPPVHSRGKQQPMQSYIVRIYRSEKEDPRTLIGTVEKVGRSGRNAFTNIDEMWEILNRWPRARAGRGRSGVRKKKA